MYVEINNVMGDEKLQRVAMRFYVRVDFNSIEVKLESYHRQRRKTRRHGWVTGDRWNSHNQRDSNIDEPNLSAPCKAEAIELVKNMITWKEQS